MLSKDVADEKVATVVRFCADISVRRVDISVRRVTVGIRRVMERVTLSKDAKDIIDEKEASARSVVERVTRSKDVVDEKDASVRSTVL